MSSAQFSVRWVHKNPVLVTGFVNTAVDWLAVIFQIIADGRVLSNPLRAVEPKELGQKTHYEWVDPEEEIADLEDFWNDILCPAAVSEESDLYYTRSRWLAQFPWWPGPLAISDFRALLLAPWLTNHFSFESVVIVPNGRMFVNDMYFRRKENRPVIRLENLEPLVQRHPELCPIPFQELLDYPHTTGKFAAIYAILNRWFEQEASRSEGLHLFPYDSLALHAFEAIEALSESLGLRRRKSVGEAIKAVRISYNGQNYQKIPHSPKSPEGWKTTLHSGQVKIIDEMLERMNCPVEGVASWSLSEQQVQRIEAEKNKERSRRRRSSRSDETPPPMEFSESPPVVDADSDSRIQTRSSGDRHRRRSSRGEGGSRGGSSSRSSGKSSSRRPKSGDGNSTDDGGK